MREEEVGEERRWVGNQINFPLSHSSGGGREANPHSQRLRGAVLPSKNGE